MTNGLHSSTGEPWDPGPHTYANSSAEITDGIWRMRLRENDYYDTGYAYGVLLTRMRYPIIRILKSRLVSWIINLAFRATRKHFSSIRVPDEYLDELRGYADATGISYTSLYFINFCFDILKRYGFHCSTISLVHSDRTLICRNTDLLPWIGSLALRWLPSIVVDIQTLERCRFVHIAPGFFLGAINGFNECGVAIASHQVLPTREPAVSEGLASILLPRILLEQSGTAEEARHIVHRKRIRRCLNMMVTSASEKTSHIYEISPEYIHVITAETHYLCCATHFQHEDLHRLHRSSIEGSEKRLHLMNTLARESTGTIENAIAIMQNVENGTSHNGSGFSPTNEGTYQSFVIDLTHRALYISNGKTLPVSLSGKYRAVLSS